MSAPSPKYFPSEFGIKAQLAEVRREISFRRMVYPRMVLRGRKTQEDADRQIAAMQAVEITLTEVLRTEADRRQPRLL